MFSRGNNNYSSYSRSSASLVNPLLERTSSTRRGPQPPIDQSSPRNDDSNPTSPNPRSRSSTSPPNTASTAGGSGSVPFGGRGRANLGLTSNERGSGSGPSGGGTGGPLSGGYSNSNERTSSFGAHSSVSALRGSAQDSDIKPHLSPNGKNKRGMVEEDEVDEDMSMDEDEEAEDEEDESEEGDEDDFIGRCGVCYREERNPEVLQFWKRGEDDKLLCVTCCEFLSETGFIPSSSPFPPLC